MTDKVCLVAGVGQGIGAAIASRFAGGSYRVAMLARNRERLAILENELSGSSAFAFDLADLDRLLAVCESVRANMGVPDVVVHNAVRATFDNVS